MDFSLKKNRPRSAEIKGLLNVSVPGIAPNLTDSFDESLFDSDISINHFQKQSSPLFDSSILSPRVQRYEYPGNIRLESSTIMSDSPNSDSNSNYSLRLSNSPTSSYSNISNTSSSQRSINRPRQNTKLQLSNLLKPKRSSIRANDKLKPKSINSSSISLINNDSDTRINSENIENQRSNPSLLLMSDSIKISKNNKLNFASNPSLSQSITNLDNNNDELQYEIKEETILLLYNTISQKLDTLLLDMQQEITSFNVRD
ncbi:hypothetical protein AYI69_g4709 [Smittium culicis]|uniref:Uncharacterized protein n=1 Tax=Smittium culicis TaxID=133412 RepID=A0A1R1YBK0_9FUNG|nr:hypothetical protein AYI69_g4709 [Smittium culicis]